MTSDTSILCRNISSTKMGTPILHEFKKQASFFFRDKIKTARLALTDVTPAQLMTEEATEGNPWPPDSRTLSSISQAAFDLDDYCRIIEILQKRLSTFDERNWRVSYNSLIVLQHLLMHGPESVAKEFRDETEVFNDMGCFEYIDEKGFNWGLAVKKQSERIVKLLEMGDALKEERESARKVSRGIKGFGSFSEPSSSKTRAVGLRRSNSQWDESSENGKDRKMEKLKCLIEERFGPKGESKSLLSGGEEDCRSGDECRGRESVGEEEQYFYETEKWTPYSPLATDDHNMYVLP